MRLIRDDYDPAMLPVFDETNVVDWGRLGRRAPSDLVNSVTVRFTDAWTDDIGAVSVTDTARVQAMGEVIATTLDYPGVRYQSLALRLAERDLRALSAPLLSGEITVSCCAWTASRRPASPWVGAVSIPCRAPMQRERL